MEQITARDMTAVFARLNQIMTSNKRRLIELDGSLGDGDLGLTMSQGFEQAYETVQAMSDSDVGAVMTKAGMTIARHAPSTMGTLMGTGFMKGGKAIQGSTTVGLEQMTTFFEAFVEGVMARGKSKPGEKTVLDALFPAVQSLRESQASGRTLTEAFEAAAQAATVGAEATRDMVAQRGRGSYYGEGSLGKLDPGAVVGMLLMQGFVARNQPFTP